MAFEGPHALKITGFVAGVTLATSQYRFVELDTDSTVIIASGQGIDALGVLQNDPGAGEECEIVSIGVTKLVSDAATVVGDTLTPAVTNLGAADNAPATGDFVCGKALTAAAATPTNIQLITAAVCCIGQHVIET